MNGVEVYIKRMENRMKKMAFIPCRMSSTRLPGKHMLMINNREMLAHLIDRVKLSHVDNIVVCTTTAQEDDALVNIARRENVLYFKGDSNDILKRYTSAAEYFGADFIVNVDGDDVLCDPTYIDKVLARYAETNADVVMTDGLPFGIGCFGFKYTALKHLTNRGIGGDTNWGGLFTKNSNFKQEVITVDFSHNVPHLRFSLDIPDDFKELTDLFRALYIPGKVFKTDQIIQWGLWREYYKKHPDIMSHLEY